MLIRLARAALLTNLLLAVALPDAARAAEAKEKGSYVSIDTLTAMVMNPGGRRQVITMQVGVDCDDPKLHAYAEMVQPRLRDAYAQLLQLYAGGLQPNALPDVDYLARRMQTATDQVLGKPGGKFLIGGIMVN